jgi:hypothetical protein
MYHIFTWVRYFIDKAGKLALLIGYVIRKKRAFRTKLDIRVYNCF